METRSLDRMLAIFATLCAVTVGLMVLGIICTKSSQDFYQAARTFQAYADHMKDAPMNDLGLRINLGLDNLFVVFYATFFVMLAVRLKDMLDPRIVSIALAAMLLTALLDAIENHHIMTMVHSVENGLPVSAGEGQFQMVVSQVKFHASYFAVLLFSFGYWQFGKLGRVIACSLWCYIPCGVLISVMPIDSTQLLVLGRTIFFVLAFVMSAIVFFGNARNTIATS